MALTQSHFRFGIDSGTESTHGWHAAEDTNPAAGVIAVDTVFLLRFCVQANTTGLSNVDNEFQYSRNGGAWVNITTSSSVVRAVAAVALTNGGNCTKRLSGTGTFESSGAGQTEDGTSGGSANDIVASGNSETECGLMILSADVSNGDTIAFRLTRDVGVLLDTYAVTPTITVQEASEIVGALAVTLGDATLAAAGSVEVVGSAGVTLDGASLAAAGSVDVVGQAAVALDGTSLAAAGSVDVAGQAAITLGDTTLSAEGTTPQSGIDGQLAVTLEDATLVASTDSPPPVPPLQVSVARTAARVVLPSPGCVCSPPEWLTLAAVGLTRTRATAQPHSTRAESGGSTIALVGLTRARGSVTPVSTEAVV